MKSLTQRAAELMDAADIKGEARVSARPLKEWLPVLGLSLPAAYRLVETGSLRHLKHAGKTRRGRGRAGAVRVRAIDVFEFVAKIEVGG